MRRIASVALVAGLLAGCAKAPTPGFGRHPWTIAHRLRVAMPAEPPDLNPYDSDVDMSYDIASLVYSYLIVADDRGRIAGDLAAMVPSLANGGISRDGLTYTYHLRDGVRWQDGSPFTSADVLASYRAIVDPHHDVLDRDIYERVRSIAAPDRKTVVVRLTSPYPPFVTRFFAPVQEGGRPILSARELARDPALRAGAVESHPMGTGPFEFVSWKRGDSIEFRRFDGYFRGRPRLDGIDLITIPDFATAANELVAHHVDLVAYAAAPLLPLYRSAPGARVTAQAWNVQTQLLIDSARPALRDAIVREAIASSIPYATILSAVSRGAYQPARNTIPPTALGYEALPERSLDLTRANRLLDSAGWLRGADGIRARNGVKLAFALASVGGMASFNRIAVLVQSSLAKAGIGLTIRPYPIAVITAPDGPVLDGTFDLSLFTQTLPWDPDQYSTLGCDQWFPKGSNVVRYCDPALDALERRGLQTLDPARRAAIYRAAGRLIWTGLPFVPLYEGRRIVAASTDLSNYRPNATATPWWNAWEWDI